MILINLIESKKPKKHIVLSYSIILIAVIIIELFAFATVYLYQNSAINSLRTRKNGLKYVASIVKRLENKTKIVKNKSNSIKKLRSIRYNDISFMNRFGDATVPDIWIDYLSKGRTITVSGKAFSYASIAKYMISLEKKGGFKNVSFEGKGLSRSGGTPQNPIVSFKIRFK